ncbi:NAD(P)H-hydrate dehydratase [Marinomonas sp. TI.3.20]|uniref:NAD(P)H-hydrate dehydratase n=1 Tax=Marinomonas sp. TI.3.20 TaxID=3121296 RepID=UPI00311F3EE4
MTKRIESFSVQPAFDVAGIRQIETALFDAEGDSFSVMQRAANALFKHISTNKHIATKSSNSQRFIVIVGGGNNGGDGLVLALLLTQAGMNVVVLDCAQGERKGDALKAYEAARAGNVLIEPFDAMREFTHGVVVDGVLGIGARLPITGPVLSVVRWINSAKEMGAYVVAIDISTGIDSDTGYAEECVYADLTVSMVQRKLGHYLGAGAIASGRLINEALGSNSLLSKLPLSGALFGQSLHGQSQSKVHWFDSHQLAQNTPCPRYPDGHKGRYGHVAVFGGDHGYGGAAIMASEAASKSGAGTVALVTRGEHLAAALARNPNVMTFDSANDRAMGLVIRKNTVVVLGPGLGRDLWGRKVFQEVIDLALPVVLDADGLFWLSQDSSVCLPEGSIITPHIGEASRLLGWSVDEINRSLIKASITLAKKYHCVAILKGVTSVVANSMGTVYITGKSEPVLSKGGSGDVLSGLVGAALAYYKTPLEAALIAAAWHNYAAGEMAKDLGERRGQPYELLDYLE